MKATLDELLKDVEEGQTGPSTLAERLLAVVTAGNVEHAMSRILSIDDPFLLATIHRFVTSDSDDHKAYLAELGPVSQQGAAVLKEWFRRAGVRPKSDLELERLNEANGLYRGPRLGSRDVTEAAASILRRALVRVTAVDRALQQCRRPEDQANHPVALGGNVLLRWLLRSIVGPPGEAEVGELASCGAVGRILQNFLCTDLLDPGTRSALRAVDALCDQVPCAATPSQPPKGFLQAWHQLAEWLRFVVEKACKHDLPRLAELLHPPESIPEIEERIPGIACLHVNVLLVGETGTGKAYYARKIHDASPRKNGPFLPVDCAGLPKERVEAELFGHVKGAFTGADADKPGLIRGAQGGTVFLEALGELPEDCWVNLAYFLQDKGVRPVGGKMEKVDVRVLAGTNRLESVRDDLRFRLPCVIRLPPLRARREEIAALAGELLEAAQRGPRGISKSLRFPLEQRKRLADADYDWPENVRQLGNAIVDAATRHKGGRDLTAEEVLEAAKRREPAG